MSFQSTRMQRITTSPSMAVSQAAKQMIADGIDVIDLSLGEPDFPTPPNVVDACTRALAAGSTTYSVPPGLPEFRAAIAEKLRTDNGVEFGASEIMVGVGAKQVIYNALMATIEPGDEVVVLAPYFVSYPAQIALAGGEMKVVQCRPDNGFRPLRADLEAAMSEATRWVIVNTPSNPSGVVLGREDLRMIGDVVSAWPRALVLSDEIYEKIVFDSIEFTSFGEACPDLRDRTLLVNGLSKSHAMTGWRLGYGAGPAELIAVMSKLSSQSTTSPTTFCQVAGVEALLGDQSSVESNRVHYQRRRDLLVDALDDMELLAPFVPSGAFYLFADCSPMLGCVSPSGVVIENDTDAATYLLREARVACVPGAAYGAEPFVRFSFATSEGQLERAALRIAEALNRLERP